MTGYLKLLNQPSEHMKKDVAAYVRHYSLERLHTTKGNQSPITMKIL